MARKKNLETKNASARHTAINNRSAQPRKRRLGVFTILLLLATVVVVGLVGWFAYSTWLKPMQQDPVKVATLRGRTDLKIEKISKEQIDNYSVAPDKPRYFSIPALGIKNARVEELGVKANNQLDDPANINDVGWYKESAKPGSGTSAGLYDGHNVGNYQPGVFVKLGKLKAGDKIIIQRGDGQSFTYVAKEIEIPKLADVDMEKMLAPVSKEREGLNIITCGGTWDVNKNTFDHRVTVRAARAN